MSEMTSKGFFDMWLSVQQKTIRLTFMNSHVSKEIALVVSVIASILAYVGITYFWWSIVISYSLLCYYFVHTQDNSLRATFAQGLFWGMCIYGFHLYPLLLLAYSHARFAGHVFLIFVCCYMSLCAAIWFILTHTLLNIKMFYKFHYLICGMSVYAYIYWIDRYSFFIFGCCEGYGGLHPLVLCMQDDICRMMVGYIGTECATILFVSICIVFAAALTQSSSQKTHLRIIFVGSLFFVVLHCLSKKDMYAPSWLSKVGIISLPLQTNCTGKQWDIAQELYKKIDMYIRENSQVELIILPESTFCFELNLFPEIIQFLLEYTCHSTHNPVALILGSHRKEGKKLYNALYYLSEKSVYTYDKTHGLLGAERIPHYAKWLDPNKSLLIQGVTFKQAAGGQALLKWQDIVFQPYICSELFFTSKQSCTSMLCIANDAWYVGTFLPKLLALTAVYKSIIAQQEIIYVAHEYAFYAKGDIYIDLKNKSTYNCRI